jgi:NTP pyrophosphatase (non-canonical NTP hydrolase)
MSTHFNGLSPAEAERLALLLEELGEAQQAIGKILRHGYESGHPTASNSSNREDLEGKLGDVTFAIKMLTDSGDLDARSIASQCMQKRDTVGQYLHHAGVIR